MCVCVRVYVYVREGICDSLKQLLNDKIHVILTPDLKEHCGHSC